MSLPIIMSAAAESELDDSAARYEIARAGLGTDFMTRVRRVLDTIANQPDRYPLVFKDVREAPVSRFPYCVYYRDRGNHVFVLAVFHTSRNPAVWQARS
jgi:plasmid stabilization system protein ParE